jgi:transcriptional regulator with XRE-family HTH domain
MAKTFTSPSLSPTPTFEVGSKLRRRREARGESLEQVAAATRISADYLSALERDAPVSAFPAPMYARAFLRSYARHLGLSEDDLMLAFSTRHGAGDPPPRAVIPLEEPPSARPSSMRWIPTGMRDLTSSVSSAIRPGHRTGPMPGNGRKGHNGTGNGTMLSNGSGRSNGRGNGAAASNGAGGASVPVVISRNGSARPKGSRPRRAAPPRRVTRGLVVGLAALPLLALLLRSDLLLGSGDPKPATTPNAANLDLGPELPRGGRTIFPDYRVVAYYGAARTDQLGVLGIGPEPAAKRLLTQAAAYDRPARPVLPAFELIGTLATKSPGDDGMYRTRMSDSLVGGYLDTARKYKMLFVIDVQPGRADFLPEVKAWEKYLRQPDVGLALDPEWHVGPNGIPGNGFVGSIDAKTVNAVGDWLAALVRKNHLPQKLLIIHQFTADMIKNRTQVKAWPELATVFDVDGFGSRETKIQKWNQLTANEGPTKHFHGFKLFYDWDEDLMGPKSVLRLQPKVDLIVYQ